MSIKNYRSIFSEVTIAPACKTFLVEKIIFTLPKCAKKLKNKVVIWVKR